MTNSTITTNINHHTQVIIDHHKKALIINSTSAKIHRDLGNLYLSSQDFENSAIHYLKAIQIEPDLFLAYYRLKTILENASYFHENTRRKILEQGIDILKQNIISQPKFFFAHVVLGELYAQQGELEKAKLCFQKASFERIKNAYPHLKESWNHGIKRQPNFLVIGLFKCGTTSFYRYLAHHPQVLPAVTKEVRFFSKKITCDKDYYLAHFPAIFNQDYLTGEATPSYFICLNRIKQIKDWFPNIKLILLLRNPIERTISGFYMRYKYTHQYLDRSLNNI